MRIPKSAIALLPFALASMVFLAGCVKSDPPRFNLNMVEVAEKELTLEQQQTDADVLEALFGTPDDPFVLPETKLNLDKIRLAAGPVWSDQHGKERGLFRRHCVHCHGITGDGAGPTAAILNPYPRDYRQGKFKFKSTERAAMPTDADLKRILHDGVPDTAMPSFALLPDDEIEALVEYVKYLSMRGQTEIKLIDEITQVSEGEKLPLNREMLVDNLLDGAAKKWATAADQVVFPPEPPARTGSALEQSIAAGRTLYYGTIANCFKCHGPSALGDGQASDYDDWNTQVHKLEQALGDSDAIAQRRATIIKDADENAEKTRQDKELSAEDKETALKSIEEQKAQAIYALDLKYKVIEALPYPPRTITPRNLRAGVYRGGRRPLDIFHRLYTGINGTPMPAVGPATPGGKGTLTPEQMWNLVDYVLSLPYEAISRPPRPANPLAQD